MLANGSVVAGYRIERVLGAGGMGTVYLVANPELPRLDALKVLSAELSYDEQFRSRFIREADVASRMNHPNIVAIYRRGQTEDGQLWIAMQFVEGIDADEALRRGQLTPERALHIVGEIAKALDYAHRHQVIHRDVKPANFLLEDGPDDRVLLGDFGIARALDDAGLTTTGSMVTTVAYAAPEVLASDPVDGRADLYSLGCTLFRMLTGKTPFSDARGAPAIMMAHLSQPPPRVSDHVPGLPPALDQVIATAMAKDPARRFASGADLAGAARAALHRSAHGVTPTPGHTGYPAAPTQPWLPPEPATLLANTAGPTAAFGAAAAPTRRRRRGKIIAALVGVVLLAAAATVAITLTSGDKTGPPTAHPPAATTTTSTSTTAPPAPIVAPAALSGLLLSPEELAGMMGTTEMVILFSFQSPVDDSPVIEPKQCVGAWAADEHATFADSGWTAVQDQMLQNSPDIPTHRVIQAVAALPSVEATQKLLADQARQWSGCAGQRITLNYAQAPEPQHWTFQKPTRTDTTLSLMQVMEGGGGMACQHVLAVRNNVVVDVLACRVDIATKAMDIADAIRAKIPA